MVQQSKPVRLKFKHSSTIFNSCFVIGRTSFTMSKFPLHWLFARLLYKIMHVRKLEILNLIAYWVFAACSARSACLDV